SEQHTSELQSLTNLVCRLLLEKKNNAGQMNERDYEAVTAQLVARGYSLAKSARTASVMVRNTCSLCDQIIRAELYKLHSLVSHQHYTRRCLNSCDTCYSPLPAVFHHPRSTHPKISQQLPSCRRCARSPLAKDLRCVPATPLSIDNSRPSAAQRQSTGCYRFC